MTRRELAAAQGFTTIITNINITTTSTTTDITTATITNINITTTSFNYTPITIVTTNSISNIIGVFGVCVLDMSKPCSLDESNR